MKWKLSAIVIAVLFLAPYIGLINPYQPVQAKEPGGEQQITVLNPLGTPPPITLKPMAPRLSSIKGKTIYIVNDGYPGSGTLLKELEKGLKKNYPDTTFVYRDKKSFMSQVDQDLWNEMEEKADAMIIALGH